MLTAQDIQSSQSSQPVQPAQVSVHSGGAEAAPATIAPNEDIQPLQVEVELSQEVVNAGVQQVHETVELPPDLKNLGVTTLSSNPVSQGTPTLPQVSVPLSDQQILAGLHAPITSALLWLSAWCMKKLRKAGISLKVDHGKIERIKKIN